MTEASSIPKATPDAAPDHWVTKAPAALQPYLRLARLDRPIGTWLLYIPCLWGLSFAALAEGPRPALILYAVLMGIGALVMRGAGCVYNDIVDRDFDAKVERTALRPIPAGQVSVKQAFAFLIGLSLTGLLVLLQLNGLAILLGIGSLGLVAIYPFMKRVTYWPQAWLGLTFNWGALVGFAAGAGHISLATLAIYGAGIFWTLGYDTIYAHQDTDDDAMIGVKSTALRLGAQSRPWLIGFYGLTVAGFALAGILIAASLFYFVALLPAALHFGQQIRRLDINDSHNCLTQFKSNRDAGLLLCCAPLCEVGVRFLAAI